MPSLKQAFASLANKNFWLDAALVIAGYKAADMVGSLVSSRVGFLPDPVKPFVGPALVVAIGSFVGDNIGRGIKLGAIVHAADSVLDMVGVPGLKA